MSAASRLRSVRRFLEHARTALATEIGFVLWDGSTVPADLVPDALAIAIADEGAIAALLRRPNVDTLINLWVSARLDIRNGTIFDLIARRPKVRSRELLKKLDKRLVIATAASFLLVSRGGPWPLESIADRRAGPGGAAGNRENIQYHYDLSNIFYTLFLDPEMVYSCAYFTAWDESLAAAQQNKLDMICRKLRLKPGESFFDIGCGWGALVCHAARHYGVRAYGATLSEEQYAFAKAKIARLGLDDRVTIDLKDYRAIDRKFDKIASIGMFEHVGIDNHAAYFAKVRGLLNDGGLYLHHAITRPAKRDLRRFRKKRPEYAAITRYIFPGGELDHIGMTISSLENGGFEVHDVEGWREHYQRTCRHWHDRLFANRAAAEREVGSVKTRLWLAYLAGCSIAFERNTVRIFQTLASKRRGGASGLPPTRGDLYE